MSGLILIGAGASEPTSRRVKEENRKQGKELRMKW
jgi:hypothetical protein